MGLGGFPASDPLFIGMLGMHGTYESNMAMYECDVMLAVGARFDDRVTGDLKKFSPTARIIHVDADPTSIGKNVRVEVPIVGEAKEVLADMHALIPDNWRAFERGKQSKNGGSGSKSGRASNL